MFKKTEFLKTKDLLLKIINISGAIYVIWLIFLISLGVAFNFEMSNKDLKNSVIVFGVACLIVYLIQLITSIYLYVGYVKLFQEVHWKNYHLITNQCLFNLLVVVFGFGFLCFVFAYQLKKNSMDVTGSYLQADLGALVPLDLPYYETDKGTNLLDAESYDFNIPLDVINEDQETPATNH